MKDYLILLLLPYHLIATAQVEIEYKDFLQKGMFETQISNLGPGCRIKIDLPKGVKLGQGDQRKNYRGMAGFSIEIDPHFSNNGKWGVDFRCYATNEEQFRKLWKGISPQEGTKFSVEGSIKKITDDEGGSYYQVQSGNSEGWALTYDDTAGEEQFRLRHLWYCVKSKESAICGSSDIGYIDFINNKTNIDIPSYTLRILESIEFLEDAPPN